jgi:uncharacterized protein YhaN
MRFSRLELIKYGQLEDCTFEFADRVPDLHIIFGQNEAGKSTTLAAISDLLFEFGHTTPYAFRHDKQLLRIGAALQKDGKSLYCRRKKARAGSSLIDADEKVIDDAKLATFLSGQTRDSFHRMFSLDHVRLREGGQAILEAEDDIGKAIFAAGSGLVSVSEVLDNLEAEAKQIWIKRAGGSQDYQVASRTYEEARLRFKSAQIKPAAWEQLRREIDQSESEIAQKRELRRLKETERNRIERRRRTLAPIGLYKQTQTELEELAQYQELPSSAPETLHTAVEEIATAETEANLAKNQIETATALVESITFQQALIDNQGEIEALREEKGAVDKALKDLPRRQSELTTAQAALRSIQKELGWPLEEASDAQLRLPRQVDVAELRDLLERKTALDAVLSSAIEEDVASMEKSNEAQDDIDTLGVGIDISALAIALEVAQSKGDVDASVASAIQFVKRKQDVLDVGLAKLSPWVGEPSALEAMVLPTDVDITEAVSREDQTDEELTKCRNGLKTEFERRAMLDLQHQQMLRDDGAVPPQAVGDARLERNVLWETIREHLLGDISLEDPPTVVAEFPSKMDAADSLADQRYTAAEQSGRLAAVIEDMERTDLGISQTREQITQTEANKEQNKLGWEKKISLIGIDLGPRQFMSWLDKRANALHLMLEIRDAEDNLAEARRVQRECKSELSREISSLDPEFEVDEERSLATLIQKAQQLKRESEQLDARRIQLNAAWTNAVNTAKRAKSRKTTADNKIKEWNLLWIPAVQLAALDPQASIAVIRQQLIGLDEARTRIDEILNLTHRVATMTADISNFAERVSSVADACVLQKTQATPADTLILLSAALSNALTLMERKSGLREQIRSAKLRQVKAEEAKTLSVARLEPLMKTVGVVDHELLAPFVEYSAQIRALKERLSTLGGQIITLGEGLPLDELLEDGSGADSFALKETIDQLQEECDTLTTEIEELTKKITTAKVSFQALDKGPVAASEAADMELAKSEMALHAERYLKKRAQISLLSWAIEQYRAEKQNPLLKRASELFSILTLGRYSALLVDADSSASRLSGVSSGGKVVPVAGMSEGTVDQLFLSLRVAAVEDAVAGGTRLPFLADDLFINYDDARAGAGFKVLAQLAKSTQVLFFTHHRHLVDIARKAVAPEVISECSMPEFV